MTTASTSTYWVEDFYYNANSNEDPPFVLPPALDYSGTVVTGDGTYELASGGQTMWNDGDPNVDRNQAYGGMPNVGIAYLRLREMGWNDVVGVFLQPNSSKETTFSWDMSFTGHKRDKIYVLVRAVGGPWQTRMTISGYQGFPWSTRSITIPKGICQVAIVCKTAAYEPDLTAQGTTTASGTLGQPYNYVPRFLRLTNFLLGYPAADPQPRSQSLTMFTNSVWTSTVTRTQFLKSSPTADSRLMVATLLSPRIDLMAGSTLTVAKADTGVEVKQSLSVESSFTVTTQLVALSVSATGGFHIGANAGASVESTIVPTAQDYIRPLRTVRLVMARPGFVKGKPMQPRARSTTEVQTLTQAGQVIGRISPYSAKHVYPGTQPTYRWLSLEARRDGTTRELTTWTPLNDPTGPAWTTPGAYRPQVEDYLMQSDQQHISIAYPAVTFDSTKLDHLNITLPSSAASTQGVNGREITFLLVGSFTRYRGQLRDSCPILDFTQSATIDYTTEMLADRQALPKWADSSSVPSIYTGWTPYSDANPQMSMLSYRGSSTSSAIRTAPYFDNQPVVMVITVAGLNSYVSITSIMGTGVSSGRVYIDTPREIFSSSGSALPLTFSLAKSRITVPFGGQFQTGSMSLLEVATFNKALSRDETAVVSNYLAGVYAPASIYEPSDYNSTVSLTNPMQEDMLFTTGSQAVWYLHDNQATKVVDETSINALLAAMPLVYVEPTDYAALIASYGDPDNV